MAKIMGGMARVVPRSGWVAISEAGTQTTIATFANTIRESLIPPNFDRAKTLATIMRTLILAASEG